MPKNSVEIN